MGGQEILEEWFWPAEPFSKLKTTFWNYWTSIKIKISMTCQCWTQSIFRDTINPCYCKLRLVTHPWWGLRGRKFLILITLGRWKKHFQEKKYIKNYFYLRKSTKTTKTTSQKCWRNIIWADFFWVSIPHKRYQNTSGFAGTCVYKEYNTKIEMVLEWWLQLKTKLLLSYNMNIVI